MFVITPDPIDAAALERAVASPSHGCRVVFTGVTRDHFDGRRVTRLEYEAYESMAIAEMARIADDLTARWPGVRVAMAHRTGSVPVGESSVVIAVGAPHRAEGFDAARCAIDTLKECVPIWKKEFYDDGSAWKANASAHQ